MFIVMNKVLKWRERTDTRVQQHIGKIRPRDYYFTAILLNRGLVGKSHQVQDC